MVDHSAHISLEVVKFDTYLFETYQHGGLKEIFL